MSLASRSLLILMLFAISACGWRMMPAPYLYSPGCREVFRDLPADLQVTQLDVLYATDRAPEPGEDGAVRYGYQRSRSLAFGRASVAVDPSLEWPDLVAYSSRESSSRSGPRLEISSVEEIARFPETPYVYRWDGAEVILDPETAAARVQSVEATRRTLLEYLERTPRKEVFLFVHGVNRSFEQAVLTAAETWHFLGREGVPIVYTWPARVSFGALSYGYDRESGEFTIYHLKQVLQDLASIPEIEKINILAHSRGVDVVLTALRELFLERRALGPEHVEALHIGRVALLAADLDLEVASQRIVAEAMGSVAERITAYVYQSDNALSAAGTIFRSGPRVGNLDPQELDEHGRVTLASMGNVDVVVYEGSKGGAFGHFYFRDNPAVSSDVLLWMRYGLLPGAENGRPLEPTDERVWTLRDGYLEELPTHRDTPACR